MVAGVSGGPDSIALASVLHQLQPDLRVHLVLAHYNHALRAGADADQKFVEKFSQKLNLPCHIGRWRKTSRPRKGSLEELARMQRLKFFNETAKKYSAPVVALAHNQDDLAETVLMRILRGSGLSGLRGIMPKRKFNKIEFIRPFFNVPRTEILEYLKRQKLSYRTDPTNKQEKFFRNKIRLKLLPLLKRRYNANIREVLTNISENVSEDYEFLEDFSQKAFNRIAVLTNDKKTIKLPMEKFSHEPVAIKRMVLRKTIETLKGNTRRLNFQHMREITELIRNKPRGTIVHLPQGIHVRKDSHYIVVYQSVHQKA